ADESSFFGYTICTSYFACPRILCESFFAEKNKSTTIIRPAFALHAIDTLFCFFIYFFNGNDNIAFIPRFNEITSYFCAHQNQQDSMPYNLLKGKKGIIFGALDEKSIAWRTALSCHAEGAQLVLSNAPVALRMGEINKLSEAVNAPVIGADVTNMDDLKK